jgi:transposase
MKRKSSLILTEELYNEAFDEYQKLKDSKLSKKLLAIIAFKSNTSQEISRVLRIAPSSLFRWLKQFKEKGIEGLKETRGGNYPAKLSEEEWEEVKEKIVLGKDYSGREINWTLKKLQQVIEEEYAVKYSTEGIRKKLHKMGLSLRRPRVRHYKSDKKEQESFKKNERKIENM